MKRGALYEQLAAVLPERMKLPEPLAKLYAWIEQRGHYRDTPNGMRIGFLYPLEDDGESNSGTWVEFFAEGFPTGYEFGDNTASAPERLCVFAKTGADGSMAALWLDADGATRVVHLGSGSGSTMLCVLAEDAVDFLRLCAIGYDELCWGEELSAPPEREHDLGTLPNPAFRRWVETTFSTTVPSTGAAIVKHPDATMESEDSEDPFWRWCMESAR